MSIVYRTLRDYANTYQVRAYCSHCRHSARLDYMRIAQLVGWDVPVPLLNKSLRCSKCGARRGSQEDSRRAAGVAAIRIQTLRHHAGIGGYRRS